MNFSNVYPRTITRKQYKEEYSKLRGWIRSKSIDMDYMPCGAQDAASDRLNTAIYRAVCDRPYLLAIYRYCD